MARLSRIAWSIGLYLLAQCAPAVAQVTTADLIGRVTDNTGAVMPGVTVTITHTGTGDVRSQVTSGTGDYAFNLLPGGTYLVKSELQGFKTQEARVTVAAGDRARLDAKLEIGSITESVQEIGRASCRERV